MSWAIDVTGAILDTESHSQRAEEGVVAKEIENAAKELQPEQEVSQCEHTVRTVSAVAPMES